MKRPPSSVTAVSWILIVISVLNLIASAATINNPQVRKIMEESPLPLRFQFIILYIGLAVMLISGVVMLNGMGWGRWLYLIWNCMAFCIGFATSPAKLMLMPSLAFFVIITFFLFQPTANAYFSGQRATAREDP